MRRVLTGVGGVRRSRGQEGDDADGDGAACFPEPRLRVARVDDALDVHAKVRREERQRQEYDGDRGKGEDGAVLSFSCDGEVVGLDAA